MEEIMSRLEKQYSFLLNNVSTEEFVKIEYLKGFAPSPELSGVTQGKVFDYFKNSTSPINKNDFKTAMLGNSITPNQDKFLNLLLENLLHDRVIEIDDQGNIRKLDNFITTNHILKDTVKQATNKAKQGLSRGITYREKTNEIGDVKKIGDQYEIYDKSNNLITTITMSEEDRAECIKRMLSQIISKIIYQSTKSSVNFINVENEFCVINGDLYPISIFQEITREEPEVTEKAFNNYFMFLSNNRTIFYDMFMKKYLLRLEDTHIVGTDSTKEFDAKMLKNPELLRRIVSNFDYEPLLDENTSTIKNLQIHIAKNFSSMSKLDFAMQELKHQSVTNEVEIENYIKSLNKAQQLLTSIMTNPNESHQTDLLAYFVSLENDFSDEKINGILNSKAYYFSNDFIQKYKENPEKYKNKIILKARNKDLMLSKYSRIMEYQDQLSTLNLYLTKKIIEEITPDKWSNYFGSKYEADGKLNDKKLGSFGLANLFISYNIRKVLDVLENSNTECVGINTPKNSDKLYFLLAFNYIIDVKNIYVVDRVNNTDSNMICEMEALHTRLLAYFEKYDFTTGVAEFFSIQDAENLTFETNIPKRFERLIPSEYLDNHSLIAFCEAKNGPGGTYKYSNALSQTQSDFAKKQHSATEVIESIKLDSNMSISANALRLRTATSTKVKINRNIPYEEKTLIDRIRESIFNQSEQKPINNEDENMMNIIGCLRALVWIENVDIVSFAKFANITSMTYKEFYEIKTHLTNQNLVILKEELNIQKGFLETKKNNGSLTSQEIQEINNKISYINSKIFYIDNIIDNSISILNSSLDTETDIENVFEANKRQYDIDNKSVLFYLSETAKEKGFIKLSEKIKKYCFKLFIEDKKEFLEKEHEKHYTIYLYQTGAKRGQTAVPEVVNPNNKNKSVEIFDREMLPLKQGCLQALSRKIDSIFPNAGEDKDKYMEMADKELSSIIQVKNSKTSQTTFELKHDIEVKQNNARLRNLIDSKRNELKKEIQEIVNDPSLKEVDKPKVISSKIHGFITMIKSLSSQFVFDAKELIDQYHFEEDRETIKANHESKTRNYFAKTYEDNCSVESLIEVVIDTFKNEVESLKYKYELHGGYYFEQDLGDMETVLKISEKRTEFIKKLNQKSSVYRVSIWKIYESLVANNATLSNNKKEDLRQYIILRMAQTIREIEGKTGSKLFSQGLAEFNKDSSNPNMDEDIPRETLEQISNLEGRGTNNPPGPKL